MLFLITLAKLGRFFHRIASPNETKTDQNETNTKFIRIFAPKYCDYVQFEGILATERSAFARR
jgi:hypothetical protein